jgi:FdhD protein
MTDSISAPPAEAPPLRRNTTNVSVVAVRSGASHRRPDTVATEEPMEIRLAGPGQRPMSVAITMRTPSADFELAVGFLFSSGIIGPTDVASVRYCDLPADAAQRYNIVTVTVTRPITAPTLRAFAVNSSCGLCGTASLDDLADRCPTVADGPVVPASVLAGLPERLRTSQPIFASTGGLHGAALFDGNASLVAAREDVGRHNAVDKVVGHALLAGRTPLDRHLLMVSGRVSFEIVEKAAVAGIGLVSAVSAPTSLAVQAAHRFGVTLVGFLRDGRCNIYAHPGRVDPAR